MEYGVVLIKADGTAERLTRRWSKWNHAAGFGESQVRANRATGFKVFEHDDESVRIVALVKGAERYVFMFEDANRDEALATLRRFAANPDLSFSWYDAAVLGQKINNDYRGV